MVVSLYIDLKARNVLSWINSLTIINMAFNICYLIPVALVFVVCLYFITSKAKKTKRTQQNKFMNAFSEKPLSAEQRQALTHGAILAEYRNEDLLSMKLTKFKEEYSNGLAKRWGISSKESAMTVLDDLVSLKRTVRQDDRLPDWQSSSGYRDMINEMAKELEIPLTKVESVQSTYAWDTGRAVNVAKWSFWAGYLTEDEAWSYIMQTSDIAKKKGVDWAEYTVSFLLGRAMQGVNLDNITLDCFRLLHGKGSNVYSDIPFK